MPVLVTAEVRGQTREGYEAMRELLADALRQSPGFILHTAHPTEDGWRVLEVWESKEDSDRFFAKYVAPNLPAGIHPKRAIQTLHGLVRN